MLAHTALPGLAARLLQPLSWLYGALSTLHRAPYRLGWRQAQRAPVPLLVVGTQRIATLHRRLAEYFARHLPLRLITAPFDMPPLVEVMCWPRYVEHDPAHQWFRELLLATASPAA